MADKLRFAIRKYEPFENALKKTWKAFCDETGCKIELEAVPMDLHPLYDSILGKDNGLAKGDWDIAHMNTDWITEAYIGNKVIDLQPLISNSPPISWPEDWSCSIRKMQMFEDKILGLPFHNGPECLIYRKDLFEDEKEKQAFRKQYGKELFPPKTWDDFMNVAHFFHRPHHNLSGTVVAAYPDGHNTVFDFCLQLWTRGGELLSKNGKVFIDTDVACEGLEFYRKLLGDKNAVHPKCAEFDSVKSGMAFANGEIAMMVNWFGFASMCEVFAESKVKGKVDITNVPAGPGGNVVSLNAYWMYTIGSGSNNKQIAYDFLKFSTSPKYDKLLTMEGGIGCRTSTWEDKEVNKEVSYYHKLSELHDNTRNLPRKAGWAKIAEVIDTIVLQTIKGEIPIPDILKNGQKLINTIEDS